MIKSRFLSVGIVLTAVGAFLVTYFVYKIVNIYSDSFIYKALTQGKVISQITTYLFFLTLGLLLIKFFKHKRESAAFSEDIIIGNNRESITDFAAAEWLREIGKLGEKKQSLILIHRIKLALEKMLTAENSMEVTDVIREQSTINNEVKESSYHIIKSFTMIIPMLGFIGTILGISEALGGMGGLTEIFGHSDTFTTNNLSNNLSYATSGLGLAFYTTFNALIYAIILIIITSFQQQAEEYFLSSVDDYCLNNVLSRIYIEPREGQQITKLLEKLDALLRSGVVLTGNVAYSKNRQPLK